MGTPEQLQTTARRKLGARGGDLLTGRLSFLQGARVIPGLGWQARLSKDDPDIVPFLLISKKTPHLPLDADFRALWEPKALARLDQEIEQAERWAQELAKTAAHNLVVRFAKEPRHYLKDTRASESDTEMK